jgi:hypothetical protein
VSVCYELGGPAGVHLELRKRTGQCKLDPWAPELSGGPVDVTILCRRRKKKKSAGAASNYRRVLNVRRESSGESGSINWTLC